MDSIRDISLQACRNTTLLALISSSENVSGNQGDSSRALYCTGFSVDDCDLPACVCVGVLMFMLRSFSFVS